MTTRPSGKDLTRQERTSGARRSRRWVVGAGLATLASPALARFPKTVPPGLLFFVGNSFTRQHAIAALVCRIAAATGTQARCHPHTANGAWLRDSLSFARSISRDRGSPVPATVVLQDHSIAPLTPEGREVSRNAISVYRQQFDRAVLFETWPRADGHLLFSQPGMPRNPHEMVAVVHRHYQKVARLIGAGHAPIGPAWLAAVDDGLQVHARDGYHASLQGAWLSAMMLAAALGLPDPFLAPPPRGIPASIAARLADLAHRFSPADADL